MLSDKIGAVFGTVNILACLALLAAAPTLGWPLWAITLVCAALHALYNFFAYVVLHNRQKKPDIAASVSAATAASGGNANELWAAGAAPAATAVSGQSKLVIEATLHSKVIIIRSTSFLLLIPLSKKGPRAFSIHFG